MWLHITRDGLQGTVDDETVKRANEIDADQTGVVWRFPDEKDGEIRIYTLTAIYRQPMSHGLYAGRGSR